MHTALWPKARRAENCSKSSDCKDAQLKTASQVNLDRGQLTPRPNFFRASEHVSLKNSQDLPRRSKTW